MVKWADFLISEVQYNSSHTRIINVKRHIDTGETVGEIEIVGKSTVVTNIHSDKRTYHTTRKNNAGRWIDGDNIIAYQMGNEWFIRTDGNKTEKDNLGELPEF